MVVPSRRAIRIPVPHRQPSVNSVNPAIPIREVSQPRIPAVRACPKFRKRPLANCRVVCPWSPSEPIEAAAGLDSLQSRFYRQSGAET